MSGEADELSFVTDSSAIEDYLIQEGEYIGGQPERDIIVALSLTNCSEKSEIIMENSNEQTLIGIYLFIAGVLAVLDNAALATAFARFRGLLMSPERYILLHLCISDLSMVLLGGFLFSGTSSLTGRWLFGTKGCQFYAFAGFLFGNASISFVCLASITRCLVMMRQPPIPMTKRRIKKCIYFVWGWSLFWALCPLLGWASYDFESTGTTCTINWQKNDASYVSYILCLASLVFAIPGFIMAASLLKSIRILKKTKCIDPSASSEHTSQVSRDMRGIKMCFGLAVTCISCWSGYAVLCLWVVLYHPSTVPHLLTLLPPILAKLTPLINPIIILSYDTNLRQSAIASFLCKVPPPELLPSPETVHMTPSTDEN